jgi:putative Holliday junction resolvase
MRVLGIDLGRARTGLALSDPHELTCSPLEVLEERNREHLLQKIMRIAEEHEVTRIVVGLPRPLAGGTNAQSEEVKVFVKALATRSTVPVVTWDERYTSKLARAGGSERRSSDRAVDSVAACYILQSYLDAQTTIRRTDI